MAISHSTGHKPYLYWIRSLQSLKNYPKSPRTNGLATRLGNDTKNALNLLKRMIDACPEGDKNIWLQEKRNISICDTLSVPWQVICLTTANSPTQSKK